MKLTRTEEKKIVDTLLTLLNDPNNWVVATRSLTLKRRLSHPFVNTANKVDAEMRKQYPPVDIVLWRYPMALWRLENAELRLWNRLRLANKIRVLHREARRLEHEQLAKRLAWNLTKAVTEAERPKPEKDQAVADIPRMSGFLQPLPFPQQGGLTLSGTVTTTSSTSMNDMMDLLTIYKTRDP